DSYLAIGSNYEPVDGRLRSWLTDTVDMLFDRQPNDTMVRIDSVVGRDGGPFGRFRDPLVLDEHQGVAHSGYFAKRDVRPRLVELLAGGLRDEGATDPALPVGSTG